jgi:hypothetical protein
VLLVDHPDTEIVFRRAPDQYRLAGAAAVHPLLEKGVAAALRVLLRLHRGVGPAHERIHRGARGVIGRDSDARADLAGQVPRLIGSLTASPGGGGRATGRPIVIRHCAVGP